MLFQTQCKRKYTKIIHELNQLTRMPFFMSNTQRLHHIDALVCVCFIAKLHKTLQIVFVSVSSFNAVIFQRHLTNFDGIPLNELNVENTS